MKLSDDEVNDKLEGQWRSSNRDRFCWFLDQIFVLDQNFKQKHFYAFPTLTVNKLQTQCEHQAADMTVWFVPAGKMPSKYKSTEDLSFNMDQEHLTVEKGSERMT